MLHPEYILYRMKELQRAYRLTVLLVHVDVDDAVRPLGDITRAAVHADCTLVCAWSAEVGAWNLGMPCWGQDEAGGGRK